jgi:hypothetical protein
MSPGSMNHLNSDTQIVLLYLSYLIAIVIIPATFKVYDIFKKKARNLNTEEEKSEKYFTSKLIMYAGIEIPAALSLIAYYMNQTTQPLYMFGIVFVTALLLKPSKRQFTNDFLFEIDDNNSEYIVYMPDEFENLEVNKEKENLKNN